MNKIWILTKRELKTFFDSLIAYVLLGLFLGVSGYFAWQMQGNNIFDRGEANLMPFFDIAFWTLFFFIPLLTMRMLAEENKTGTIELLLTKSVTDWQVIFGKFLSVFILIAIALLLTTPYYYTIAKYGEVDHGVVVLGYLSLLLMSGAYTAIGLWVSSITNNQIVAGLLALVIGLMFHLIFGVMASSSSGMVGDVLSFLDMRGHFTSMIRGVVDSTDLLFYGSIIFIGLVLAESQLAKRHIA
ncbi:MAG: ABC transporter permease subunit [Bacteroidetes bacterium]|nr:ABC transporter permease subunit [Bacteroidota bacterium]